MAKVRVELPQLLTDVVGRSQLELEAETLGGALERLTALEPRLAALLFDESGKFRQHVLCFHNGVNTRWADDPERALADGDTITMMQAVSGG